MRRLKSFISLIAVSLIVTSCAAGPNAQTTTQGPTGSGDYAKVGDIYVQNVVIVKGNENVGTVVATLINDSLKSIIEGEAMELRFLPRGSKLPL